jgi:hypothetical protein
MVAFWHKPPKSKLLTIDDCLMDALDPAQADECLVEPAAPLEVVQVEWSQGAQVAAVSTAALVLLLIAAVAMTGSADQGVGELGTPQRVLNHVAYMDPTVLPGPPAF